MNVRVYLNPLGAWLMCLLAVAASSHAGEPVPLIFDTDVGNDVDDAMALAVIHELANRGEVELLAVTISKDNPWCAPFVDLVNTFYGRPDIPIGVVKGGETPEDGNFIRQVSERRRDGKRVYPRDVTSGAELPDATDLLRKVLSGQPDGSTVIVSVGFLTNLARLLESEPGGHSPLRGRELVQKKVKLYSIMGGAFSHPRGPEYNVFKDVKSSRTVFKDWPTPIVASGFEIGMAVLYPADSIEHDFGYVQDHPVAEAYRLYIPMPHNRPTWDLTAVLYAVHPHRDYFSLSYPGTITVNNKNVTEFSEAPDGLHRYLKASPEQVTRVREALVQLVSAPPRR